MVPRARNAGAGPGRPKGGALSTDFTPAPALPPWLAPSLPFTRRIGTVRGRTVHFVDHGEGPAVLLMHGNPTWCFLWRKVIAELDGFRVVAPDLLGLGLSEVLPRSRDHRLALHIDVMAGLVEALELDRLIVVGQDWGGPVAAGVGEQLQDRVAGMVWANTAVVRPRRPLRTKAFHRFSQLPLVSDVVFRGLNFPVPVLHRAQGDRSSIGRFERRAYHWPLRRIRDRVAPLGLARMVPNAEDHPTTAVMDRVGRWVEEWEGPAALVWGLKDPILGRGLGRHRTALPQARVTETDAGHFLQEEVPEALADAIRFVAEAAR